VTIALDMLVAFGGTTLVSWAYMEIGPREAGTEARVV
jgi:hypothetical protein